MGFIETHKAECTACRCWSSTHMLVAAKEGGTERFFYSSSACVYNGDKQTPRRRHRAQGRGRLPRHAGRRLRLGKAVQRAHAARHYRARITASPPAWRATTTSTARKAPTTVGARRRRHAITCRKVIAAKLSGKARDRDLRATTSRPCSFMYIDDCTDGTIRLAASDIIEPLNIGSGELVSINRLVDIDREDRRREAEALLQARRAQGARSQQRQRRVIKKLMNGHPPSVSRTAWRKTWAGGSRGETGLGPRLRRSTRLPRAVCAGQSEYFLPDTWSLQAARSRCRGRRACRSRTARPFRRTNRGGAAGGPIRGPQELPRPTRNIREQPCRPLARSPKSKYSSGVLWPAPAGTFQQASSLSFSRASVMSGQRCSRSSTSNAAGRSPAFELAADAPSAPSPVGCFIEIPAGWVYRPPLKS